MEERICTKCDNNKPIHHFMKKEKILKLCVSCREIASKSKNKNKDKHICVHNRPKWLCKDCESPIYCEHKKRRNECVDCRGTTICEHNKRRHYCSLCKGNSLCVHNREKHCCGACNGGKLYNCKRGIS